MKEYLPYIVSIFVAIISGAASYFAAAKKCKSDMNALKESNSHEIDRLMQQHKLDIDSLERKHQMEIEKMELAHKHQLELKEKELDADSVIKFYLTTASDGKQYNVAFYSLDMILGQIVNSQIVK